MEVLSCVSVSRDFFRCVCFDHKTNRKLTLALEFMPSARDIKDIDTN